MDKLKKQKHDHKLTDWLKFGIFAIIMLAPFFSIGGRMAYTIFNKNAKDSYSGANGYTIKYKYETNEVNSESDLRLGNLYCFDFNNLDYSAFTGNTRVCLTNGLYFTINNQFTNANQTIDILGQKGIYITFLGNSDFYFRYEGNFNSYIYASQITNIVDKKIYFIYKSELNTDFISYIKSSDYNVIEDIEISNLGTLDNAFDYSISKIADEPIFNWVKNTAIYNGINDMFTGLDYDTDSNPIAIMCAYWLLNTAVYIVIDIVVWAFTKMTHMFIQE